MKRFLLSLMIALTALSVVVSDADARRLGGGRSFGRQTQNIGRPAPTYSPNQYGNSYANPAPAPAVPQAPVARPSPWRGIIGGALAGLGIGALLSHFGLGGAAGGLFGSLLMILLVVVAFMVIMRLFRRSAEPAPSYREPVFAGGYDEPVRTPEIGSRIEPAGQPAALQGAAAGGAQNWGIPADFDVPGFLRSAKTYFLRLQAAWDRADMNDIREFTTPEMFAELKMQIEERGDVPNHTDVTMLNAELLGIETRDTYYLASVKFSGMIKEAEHAMAEPFMEVWNLSKPVSGQGGWVLGGIQQLQ